MSGGMSGPLPSFLAKGEAALKAVAWFNGLRLRRKTKEMAIAAQVAVVEFEREARADWHQHNRLKGSLADWVADCDPIFWKALESRQLRHADIRIERASAVTTIAIIAKETA